MPVTQRFIGICFVILLQSVCSMVMSTATVIPEKGPPIVLKVALYPIIPDVVNDELQSLADFIKTEFETAFPNITLKLRSMNDSNGFYDLDTLSQWLASDGSKYDVVEVDTVLFGDLASTGLIAPQLISDEQMADWHPAAANIVRINNAIYGYPHLLCSAVLFTRDNQTAQATTIDELVAALGRLPATNYRLVGNLDSSWDLPSLWISSYQSSSDSCTDMTAYALHAYESLSFDPVIKLARLCERIPSENHCLDGTFRRFYDLPALLFAQNQAKALFGYTERLSLILKNVSVQDYNSIKIIPMPIGNQKNQPLFTTDAFVFRRNMSSAVLSAARTFVAFMATPRMQAVIVGSLDSPYPNTIPRYLLPISKKAYDEPILATNRFYQQYFRTLNGFSNPHVGFYSTRKALQAALLKSLKG